MLKKKNKEVREKMEETKIEYEELLKAKKLLDKYGLRCPHCNRDLRLNINFFLEKMSMYGEMLLEEQRKEETKMEEENRNASPEEAQPEAPVEEQPQKSAEEAAEEVTEEAIAKFRVKLESANVDDVVCMFYAGHGLLDSELNYYLGAYNIEFQNPSKGGISYDVIEQVMDAIPPRNKFILVDACHSGEIDKEEIMLAAKVQKAENITFRAMPGTSVKQVGLDNSFELMKELFTDIRKSSGTMILFIKDKA